ncbi:sulfite exporter TauE/SafE family protein [Heliorestis acidaminivorans]|uniref:Probable membrane transporter protein n=1 Tax=Heliorestis acidaminivorans TaxID=553427 RepID=A0A6I0ES32_9FIRM|nr:sulfite exporter TauE/SafE family protein [Heliorestis acidaminivorans]
MYRFLLISLILYIIRRNSAYPFLSCRKCCLYGIKESFNGREATMSFLPTNRRTLIILLLAGVATGLVNGLVGIGGGTIVIPALVFFLGVAQHQAHGTSLAVILPTSLTSALIYWYHGHLPISLTFIVALTGMVGAYIGARLMNLISPKNLRLLLGLFMIVAGVRMLWPSS